MKNHYREFIGNNSTEKKLYGAVALKPTINKGSYTAITLSTLEKHRYIFQKKREANEKNRHKT